MLKMIEKQTSTSKNSTPKLEFTGEVIGMNIFADRCHEILLSESEHKYNALNAQVETIQRMLLPREYTAHFADIHNKVDYAIAHNQLKEADQLRAEVDEILDNDPVAQAARNQAVSILSSSIDSRYVGAFYATLNQHEDFSPSASQKVVLLGYKVLEVLMKYGNVKQNK